MVSVAWCHCHLQELFGEEGVDVLVSYLKLDLSLLTSGLGHQLLLITAIDCVWLVMSLARVRGLQLCQVSNQVVFSAQYVL